MKKVLIIIILLFSFNVYATSGSISSDTIIKCDDTYYGMHSNHYHEVYKKDGKWVIKSTKEVTPSCLNQVSFETNTVKFDRCVDGDTFKVYINDKLETVRLIGVNTPESVKPNSEVEYYGKESSEYTCDLITNAKSIKLEYDSKCDKTDKYGRILAYVYLDDVMLNKTLIKNGYAEVKYIYDDYFYTTQFYELQDEAKENKLGIWNEDNSDTEDTLEENTEDDEEELSFWDKIVDFILSIFKLIFE